MHYPGEIPSSTPVVVHCQTGARSAIAASLLQANGHENVLNLTGGFAAWQKQNLPEERESPNTGLVGATTTGLAGSWTTTLPNSSS